MEIVNRIIEIQKEVTKSQRSFELSIGKTSGYLNVIQKNNSTPGVDLILRIIEVYPEYNLNWIMMGEGEKYNKDIQVNKVSESRSHYITREKGDIEQIIEKLAEKKIDSLLKAQDEKISDLTQVIKEIQTSLDAIEKKIEN